MTKWNRVFTLTLLLPCLAMLLSTVSCSGNEVKAKKTLQEYLKGQGVTDLTVDLFYTDPNVPDKAYVSATATYNFAGSEGKLKREFLGYVLVREGTGWKVDHNVSYTTERQKAGTYLAGGK
jgi:hypothetical protein